MNNRGYYGIVRRKGGTAKERYVIPRLQTVFAALAAVLTLATAPAFGAGAGEQAPMTPAPAQEPAAGDSVDMAKLMDPGPLTQQALGDPKAPVTIVEYASLTCPHCANFHNTVYPTLKSDYIDTGKVYFVLRDFPLDQLAFAAAIAARCASSMQYFPIMDTLFEKQKDWAFVAQPGAALLEQLKSFGFTEQSLDACLNREDISSGIQTVAQRGQDFGVDGTPAFFINGKKFSGEMTVDELNKVLAPLVEQAPEQGKSTGG
jgi:protein-disulfide isomerase